MKRIKINTLARWHIDAIKRRRTPNLAYFNARVPKPRRPLWRMKPYQMSRSWYKMVQAIVDGIARGLIQMKLVLEELVPVKK